MARLKAIRGATTATANDPAAIVAATSELLEAILARNPIAAADLVSIVFTATSDLDAEFPAAAARALDLDVPLLCAREIDVPGSVPRCIRILAHVWVDESFEADHVYLAGARALRPGHD